MLDSAIRPSYNLSKNLLLRPWILKLIVDSKYKTTPCGPAPPSTEKPAMAYISVSV